MLTIWDAVRSSLWARPLLMVCIAGVLAYYTLSTHLDLGANSVWYLYSGTAKEAPVFLANLVSSMITMATLAISITMVVLTLAAQQLGPRLIRNFMADWRTQSALGLFISTVVYLLLVLRSTYGQGDGVSNLAVTVGTGLVFVCLATLLLFVHHLASSIIADNVVARVGAELDADIKRLLPAKDSKECKEAPEVKTRGAPVALAQGGYIQAINMARIASAATESDALVVLDLHTGLHAATGTILGHVTPKKALQGKESRNFIETIQGSFLFGSERSSVLDLEFSIHKLVEIALRALSPGINDPYTALAVLDRLSLSLAKMMQRGEAQTVWEDEKGKPRVIASGASFESITDAAFHQIRQHGAGLPAVLIRMAEVIGQLLQVADDKQRPALEKHLAMVLDSGKQSITGSYDLKDLEERVSAAKKNAGMAIGAGGAAE